MRLQDRTLAGLLFFVGSAQFLVVMMIGEAIQPGYNVGANHISDLGVNNTALLFNASIVLLGLLSLLAVYLLDRAQRFRPFSITAALSGIGAVGVGLFPETTGAIHLVVAGIAFVFGGLAAILAFRAEDPPLRYLSPILGIAALVALVLYQSGTFLGLGPGGMERMIVYPVLLWEVTFGGHLLAHRGETAAETGPGQVSGP